MPKAKNISDQAQAMTGIKPFEAGEEREVTVDEAVLISKNPNFEVDLENKKVKGLEDENDGEPVKSKSQARRENVMTGKDVNEGLKGEEK